MRYFCITHLPISCKKVPEHTFYGYDETDDRDEWSSMLSYELSNAISECERLKVHSLYAITEDEKKTIEKFAGDESGYITSNGESTVSLEGMEAWMKCKKCIKEANKRGPPYRLEHRH